MGVFLFIYQAIYYLETGNVELTLDNHMNGYYGLIIAIWGQFFYRSWVETEKELKFLWDTDNKGAKRDDERKDTFESHYIYNDITRVQVKLKKEPNKYLRLIRKFLKLLFLSAVIASMIIYRIMKDWLKENKDSFNEYGSMGSLILQGIGNGITFAYSCLVILFGTIYKKISYNDADKSNFRYQSEYENSLILDLFAFNSFNYFLPIFLVGFSGGNY